MPPGFGALKRLRVVESMSDRAESKARVARNPWKGGQRQLLRELVRMVKSEVGKSRELLRVKDYLTATLNLNCEKAKRGPKPPIFFAMPVLGLLGLAARL